MSSKYADLIMGEPKAAPAKPAKVVKTPSKKIYREPTLREQVDAWQALAWEINLHRTITLNNTAVTKCLERIDDFVNAHGARDKAVVIATFWEEIAQKPEVGRTATPEMVPTPKPLVAKSVVNKPKSILARKPKVAKSIALPVRGATP
jgi:hypothetical protein